MESLLPVIYVLFADNDPSILNLMRLQMRKFSIPNAEIKTDYVPSGAAAISHLESHPCHLIICDFNMEDDSSGLEVARHITRADYHPAPRFVLYTNSGEELTTMFAGCTVHRIVSKTDVCTLSQLSDLLREQIRSALQG